MHLRSVLAQGVRRTKLRDVRLAIVEELTQRIGPLNYRMEGFAYHDQRTFERLWAQQDVIALGLPLDGDEAAWASRRVQREVQNLNDLRMRMVAWRILRDQRVGGDDDDR